MAGIDDIFDYFESHCTYGSVERTIILDNNRLPIFLAVYRPMNESFT